MLIYEYPQPKAKWIAPDGRPIDLPKGGPVRGILHRPLAGTMKHGPVSKTRSRKSFVRIPVDVEIARPVYNGGIVGMDLGRRDFITLSSAEKMAPPQLGESPPAPGTTG